MSTHHAWSRAEVKRAVELRGSGKSLAYIGWELARSETAVRVKLDRQANPKPLRGRPLSRATIEQLVAELELRGYTCTPPEHPDARVDL